MPRRGKGFDHALNAPEIEVEQSQMPPHVPFLEGTDETAIRHPLRECRLIREPPLPVMAGNPLIQASPSNMGNRTFQNWAAVSAVGGIFDFGRSDIGVA